VLGSVCILLAVAAPAKLNAFWGVNFWSLWPLPWRIAAAVLGLAALWFHDRLPALPGVSNSRFGASLLPIAALSGFALLWIFLPARTLLFGDSMEVANRIGSQDWVTPRSPLYSLLVRGLGRIAGANHADLLAKAVQGISVVCGVITAALLFRLWKTRYRGMGLVLVATFLGGYIGLFQGYVEAYAVIVAAMLVLAGTTLVVRNRRPSQA
jgi:hypothetical protein